MILELKYLFYSVATDIQLANKLFKLLCQVHFTKSNFAKKDENFNRTATPMFSQR